MWEWEIKSKNVKNKKLLKMTRKQTEMLHTLNKDLKSFSLFYCLKPKILMNPRNFSLFSRDMRNKNLTTHVCGSIIFSFQVINIKKVMQFKSPKKMIDFTLRRVHHFVMFISWTYSIHHTLIILKGILFSIKKYQV